MELLDIVLENPFLIVVVLFAILSFFSRQRRQQQEAEEEKRRTEGTKAQQKTTYDTSSTQAAAKRQAELKSSTKPKRQKVMTTQMERRQSATRLARDVSTPTREQTPDFMSVSESRPRTKAGTVFSKSDLKEGALQGQMWAEVFGPPRSKNPFHTRYRK